MAESLQEMRSSSLRQAPRQRTSEGRPVLTTNLQIDVRSTKSRGDANQKACIVADGDAVVEHGVSAKSEQDLVANAKLMLAEARRAFRKKPIAASTTRVAPPVLHKKPKGSNLILFKTMKPNDQSNAVDHQLFGGDATDLPSPIKKATEDNWTWTDEWS